MLTALGTAGYLFWEVALFLGCLRLANDLRQRIAPGERDLGQFLLNTLVLNVLATAAIGMLFTFLGCNAPVTYLVTALVVLAACLTEPTRLREELQEVGTFLHQAIFTKPLALFVVVATLVPVLWLAMGPVVECDSISHLYYVRRWADNLGTPYDFASTYVSFWETSYLPSVALTREGTFLWVTSLKPVLVAMLGLYLLARELGVDGPLAAVAAANGVLLWHFWVGNSGVITIKNDMVVAAGTILLALGGLRVLSGDVNAESGLALTAGAVFVSVKFNGIAFVGWTCFLLLCLAHRELRNNFRPIAAWFGVTLVVWLLTAGHYYIRNWLVHGNPLYPAKMTIAGFQLPGPMNLDGLSILDNLGNGRLWRAFFAPQGGLSMAGVLFPLTLGATLLGSAIRLAWIPIELGRWRRVEPIAVFLAGFLLVSWMIYFRSPWSASAAPGDMFYIQGTARPMIYSLRYAEGTVALSELACLVWLVRRGFPGWALYGLMLSSMVSRVWVLYRFFGGASLWWVELTTLGVILSLAVLLQPAFLFRWRRLALGCTVLLFVLVVAPTRMREMISRHWGYTPGWHEALERAEKDPNHKLYVLLDDKTFPYWRFYHFHFRLCSFGFRQNIESITEAELSTGKLQGNPYILRIFDPLAGNKLDLKGIEALAAKHGLCVTQAGDYCMLLEPVDRREPASFQQAARSGPTVPPFTGLTGSVMFPYANK